MDEEEEDSPHLLAPSLQPLHSMTIDQIFLLVQRNENGLDDNDLHNRYRKYGHNRFPVKKKATFIDHLFDQINSSLIYVLLASAAVTIGLSHLVEGMVILLVVMIDLSFGLWLEDKSERTSQSLQKMLCQSATVRRNNRLLIVSPIDLTIGDIFLLKAGDIIPADGRIITSSGLLTMESLLTGESHAVPKAPDRCCITQTPLSERSCLIYSGTSVTKGTATCIVINIGLHCEIGKIHSCLEKIEDPKTPLTMELERLYQRIALFIFLLAALTLVIATIRGYNLKDSFPLAIAISLAAIPEELPSCVTIAFMIGIRAMAAQEAIVKVLPASEILGSVSVICSEKTGTLTKNQMVLHQLSTQDCCYEVSAWIACLFLTSPSGRFPGSRADFFEWNSIVCLPICSSDFSHRLSIAMTAVFPMSSLSLLTLIPRLEPTPSTIL
jgi:magnesium-transporting ATPase (P-type)